MERKDIADRLADVGYVADSQGGNERQVTHHNDDFLAGLTIQPAERIEYESKGGARIEGWIIKPDGFDASKKYPLMMKIHGGPHGIYGNAFSHEFQLLVAQGYVLLYVNPRGSQGYGQEFAHCIRADWGNLDYADIMAGVDHAIAQGYVDPDRLGVNRVEGVLCVDEGGYAAVALGLGHDVKGEARLPRALRPIELDDPSPGDATDAQGEVEGERPGRDHLHLAVGHQLGHHRAELLEVLALLMRLDGAVVLVDLQHDEPRRVLRILRHVELQAARLVGEAALGLCRHLLLELGFHAGLCGQVGEDGAH